MKTIFLYGAPGVGKLTVATELSKRTGFSVLHNHLLNDLVGSALDFGTDEFWDTVRAYRLDVMERAAKAKRKGIILTWVYGKPFDDAALEKIVRQAKTHNGKILFVHLVCDQKELFKRIKQPSRKAFHKVKKSKTLREIMKRRDIFSDVSYEPNFVIDNSKISPRKAANLIQKHYSL
jgi:shikimate kinase